MKHLNAALLATLVSATPTLAHEYKAGDLMVDHPYAIATPVTAQTGAGYLTITNTGTSLDRLVGVEAGFPRVMLHTTVRENDIATMTHVEAIDIPAGETVALAPGGYHVMFMGLNGDPFEVGEEIPGTLIFEHAGRIDLTFNVEARDAVQSGDAHDGHGN